MKTVNPASSHPIIKFDTKSRFDHFLPFGQRLATIKFDTTCRRPLYGEHSEKACDCTNLLQFCVRLYCVVSNFIVRPHLVASLQHADGNRAGQRRTRIEYLASVNVAGHGHNTTDRRQYRFPGSSSPCQRRNGAKAHAPPWPRPERTAHQLAAAICRCTWCPPGQVVSQQRAGRRSVRIEQLARANVAGHGHNINLVDVGTAPRIHIAVPAPRRRQGKARMRVRPCPGPERAAHGRPPFAGAVTC